MQYVVLQPISPQSGPIIEPARATASDPTPAPVLVEENLFSGDTAEECVANIARLIAAGVIAPADVSAPIIDPGAPDAPSRPRRAARTSEE